MLGLRQLMHYKELFKHNQLSNDDVQAIIEDAVAATKTKKRVVENYNVVCKELAYHKRELKRVKQELKDAQKQLGGMKK